jgi:hypothetical protein
LSRSFPSFDFHDHRRSSAPILSLFEFWKMLRTFFPLFSTLLLVIAHPTSGDSQTIIVDKASTEYQGWFDPRVNGGRFLDVRPHFNDVGVILRVTVTDGLLNSVHEQQATIPRRASEHHHHRLF